MKKELTNDVYELLSNSKRLEWVSNLDKKEKLKNKQSNIILVKKSLNNVIKKEKKVLLKKKIYKIKNVY